MQHKRILRYYYYSVEFRILTWLAIDRPRGRRPRAGTRPDSPLVNYSAVLRRCDASEGAGAPATSSWRPGGARRSMVCCER